MKYFLFRMDLILILLALPHAIGFWHAVSESHRLCWEHGLLEEAHSGEKKQAPVGIQAATESSDHHSACDAVFHGSQVYLPLTPAALRKAAGLDGDWIEPLPGIRLLEILALAPKNSPPKTLS